MTRSRLCSTILATALSALAITATAGADTAPTTSVSTTSGYQVTLTGPASAVVGQPATYTATCGGGYPCSYGEFRVFGGVINSLGEGMGRGATASYTFRAPGAYSIRYLVAAACAGSPRRSCPIAVWITTSVSAA